MKFKHLLLTASVMALFSSCSNDELVSENTSHGDAIAFSVTTTNATRAADYWCNSQLPKYFEVSTAYNNAFYFNNEVYKAEGENYVQADGNYRYWPDVTTTPLYVYAYKVKADAKNGSDEDVLGSAFAEFAWTAANAAPTITMTPAVEAKDQHDLLYAYDKVETKPAYGATHTINFRHALSQIVFYAKCSNSKIQVDIEEVALYNAAKSGVFTLPTEDNTTSPNFVEHSQAGTETPQPSKGLGTWALTPAYEESATDKAIRSYKASCDAKLLATTENWTNLTDNKNADNKHTDFNQSFLVLPQTDYTKGGTVTGVVNNNLAAYVPGNGSLKTQGGACIAIKCTIRNIASGTEATGTDVYLWGDKQTDGSYKAKDLVIPVAFTWEQGKKYIYRINFAAKGHGGYDPGTGDEVLVPIQLSVTVDDFAKVTDIIPEF